MKHEGSGHAWDRLPPTGAALLDAYARILQTRGAALGVIGPGDVEKVRERHVLDGLRGADLIPGGAVDVVDLGSGGGVPGIPIAVARPDLVVVLAERRRARAAFLEFVIDELGLSNTRVHAGPVDLLEPSSTDTCLARAFAPPAETWATASRLLRPDGALLYWAGVGFDVQRQTPEGAVATVARGGPLASGGPVVIMTPR